MATGCYCRLLLLLFVIQPTVTTDYKIGFLPSMRKGDGRKYAGAFAYAVQKVNAGEMYADDQKTPLLLSLNKTNRLVYSYKDVQGDTLRALRVMTEQYVNDTIAFIGPEDTCYFEAKVASAWNLPMIAYKCTDYRISEKNSFPTFARTFAPTDKVSKSIIAILNMYKWRKFTTIASTMPKWQATARTLIDMAKQMDPPLLPDEIRTYENTINSWKGTDSADKETIRLNFGKNFNSGRNFTRPKVKKAFKKPPRIHETKLGEVRKKLDKIMEETKHRTRIYIFLGERTEYVHFVRQLDTQVDRREYVVIAADEGADGIPQFFEESPDDLKSEGEASRKILAFRMVLLVTPSRPHVDEAAYRTFVNESKRLSHEEFNIPLVPLVASVPWDERSAVAVYDAVHVYTRALHEVLAAGGNPKNGTTIFQRIRANRFRSISGHSVPIDNNADAEGNFSVLALKRRPGEQAHYNGWGMGRVGIVEKSNGKDVFKLTDEIDWIKGEAPRDEPECGFDGDKCEPDTTNWSLISITTGAIVILIVGTVFAIRHYLYEQKLASLLWKIDYKDIMVSTMDETAAQSERMKRKVYPQYSFLSTAPSEDHNDNKPRSNTFCEVGSYKGSVVAIKRLKKKQIELNRVIKKELQLMKEMNHDNVNRFVGAVVEPSHICIVTQYCNRGSLQDILQKDDYKLDEMFRASLINDLIKGMSYLHDSEIFSHGRLKSSNCLVDSRWVLQISDFGLTNFKVPDPSMEFDNDETAYRGLLWTAPELLRMSIPPRCGTQKGDVYSFAIILHEIMARRGPWGGTDLSAREIIRRVRSIPMLESVDCVSFRPKTEHCESDQSCVIDVMEECWSEDPEQRPEFKLIRVKLKDLYKGLRSNIFDNMVALMEKYSSNLENQVEERTQQLSEEKKKTEALLHRMLPKSVAEQLKAGMTVKPEHYEEVTIYFSDICGFTEMAARTSPLEVVDLLNKLYSLFDNTIGNYDVYKVETIGDAYMVVSGLPIRNGDLHAGEIASMSLSLLHSINTFNAEKKHTEAIKLRIGIHSGPCVAGVVGHKMPRYCLFGDTVNTSSRMESTGIALKIHCSEQCKIILDKLGGYSLMERGQVNVKGKGMMRTYFLDGENASHRLRRISRDKPQPMASLDHSHLNQLSASSDSLLSTFIDEHDDTISSCKPLLTNGFMSRRSTGSDNMLMNIQLMNGNPNGGDYHEVRRQASTEFMV